MLESMRLIKDMPMSELANLFVSIESLTKTRMDKAMTIIEQKIPKAGITASKHPIFRSVFPKVSNEAEEG